MRRPSSHVFVVDDDPAFLGAVSRLIRVAGYSVQEAGSISALCDHLPFPPGSCVLADLFLDGETGLDILEILKARNESAPVVFMSATDDASTIEAAGRNSGGPCLRKPIEAEDLFDALNAAFEGCGEPSKNMAQTNLKERR